MKRANHTRDIVVPERVRLRGEQSGHETTQWLKDLPGLLADPLALAHDYCQLLATESGLDEAAIWEWGFIERVSSGLYLCAYGSSEHGQLFFKTAQRLLDA